MAVDRAAEVYDLFAGCKDYGFKDQIQRAAVSVSSNIAEGYERGSNKEFVHFLYYAKGSCGELRSQAQVAKRVNLLAAEQADRLVADAADLSARLGAYIHTRQSRFR